MGKTDGRQSNIVRCCVEGRIKATNGHGPGDPGMIDSHHLKFEVHAGASCDLDCAVMEAMMSCVCFVMVGVTIQALF